MSSGECMHTNGDHLDNASLARTLQIACAGNPSSCTRCEYSGTKLWSCLHAKCAFLGCGEKQNDCSTRHFDDSRHALVYNVGTRRIWCYQCDREVKFNPEVNSQTAHRNNDTDSRDSEPQVKRIASQRRPTSRRLFVESEAKNGRIGLRNLGNTCYLNAAVQAVSNCPPFARYFVDLRHLVVTDPFNGASDGAASSAAAPSRQSRRLASAFADLMGQMWTTQSGVSTLIVPHVFVREFHLAFGTFRMGSQQDAQEFLRCFLDRMHDELKVPLPSVRKSDESDESDNGESESGSESGCTNGRTDSVRTKRTDADSAYATGGSCASTLRGSDEQSERVAGESVSAPRRKKAKVNVNQKEKRPEQTVYRSVVSDVFEGKLLSTVRCLACGHVSTIVESFMDLSLPIPLSATKSTLPRLQADGNVIAEPTSLHSQQNLDESELKRRPRSTTQDNESDTRSVNAGTNMDSERRRLTQAAVKRQFTINARRRVLSTLFTLLNLVHWLRLSYSGVMWILLWVFSRYSWLKSLFITAPLALRDCLDAYFCADELKGDNRYYCERCRTLCNGLKYAQVLRLPEVLCIHLKRFRHDFMQSAKVHNYVDFPLDGLDMRPYLHSDCRDAVTSYDLVSVVMHHGGAGGGHYTACAFNMCDGEWYKFDDSYVERVDAFFVQQADAYILFYKKKDDRVLAVRDEVRQLLEAQIRRADSNPSLMQFYVAVEWFQKLEHFAEPGPPDNSYFVCAHGAVHPHRCGPQLAIEDRVVPLTSNVWSFIQSQFPSIDYQMRLSDKSDSRRLVSPTVTHLAVCQRCERAEQRLANRRARERREFKVMYERFQLASRNPAESIYAMSSKWLQIWDHFASGKSHSLPPPVDNRSIAVPLHNTTATNGAKSADDRTAYVLNPRSDYVEVSEELWHYFRSIYNGGPQVLVRKGRTVSGSGTQQTSPPRNSDKSHGNGNGNGASSHHNSPSNGIMPSDSNDDDDDDEDADETERSDAKVKESNEGEQSASAKHDDNARRSLSSLPDK